MRDATDRVTVPQETTDSGLAGRVFVISGPTAVGKGTLISALRERYPEIFVSISATTRKPRSNEVDGVHYLFVSDQEFDDLIAENGLLEWAEVHGQTRYGSPREPVLSAVARGEIVILEIDLQGARQVRQSLPEATQIFILPPSWEVLIERLQGRGTETQAQMQRRLETAKVELAAADEFDYQVVNDDLESAVDTLVSLIGLDK